VRGLSVLDAVVLGNGFACALRALGMTRSTTHRLATALVERRYLNFVPREGLISAEAS
jgi:DNA-binding IclR family transcriptional regulator